MLRTLNKFIPELRHSKSFDFETKHDFRGYTRLVKKLGLEAQRTVYDHIKIILKQYTDEPCEVHLCAGIQDGHTFIHGVVWLYDHKPECFRKSGLIFQGVDWELQQFLNAYPKSEFMIYYFQSVTITRILKD